MTLTSRTPTSIAGVLLVAFMLPLVFGCGLETAQPVDTIRVMTFNIRWASPDDGHNIWENRSDWVSRNYRFIGSARSRAAGGNPRTTSGYNARTDPIWIRGRWTR